jgi:hypothetical protein
MVCCGRSLQFCHFGSTQGSLSSAIDTIDPTYTLRMAMGKRDLQRSVWVATTDFPTVASHPFYTRLNQLLGDHGIDAKDAIAAVGGAGDHQSPRLNRRQ